ncbi:amidohydrolase family protein [Streptomyces albiflaviniger]|nr:amidohydrolase family protein [Streptomyces albiflaviniger]
MTPLVIEADAGWFGGRTLRRRVRATAYADGRPWRLGGPVPRAGLRLRVDGVLVPGLVDHHVHVDQIDPVALLAGGVSGVRDLGSPPDAGLALALRSRHDPGLPGVVAAGPFLTAPGGYPSDRAWAAEGSFRPVEDPADAIRAVTALVAEGVGLVKVALNADAGPVLDDPTLLAVVRTARSAGLPVVAHAQGERQAHRALAAGVDELAHTPWTERLPDRVVRAFAVLTRWTSTLDIHGWGVPTQESATALDNLRRFHRAGGRVRYGTDLGNGPLPLGVNPRELSALAEAGLSAAHIVAALAVSTTDLAVLPGDPLADPLMTSRVASVVRAGRYQERTRV